MRALANQCELDGEVILIIDFANAFNSCNRNLLIKLAATYIPEIAHLIFWLYAEETELYVSNGDTITSSEGVHQGCGFSNLLFVLLMRYVMRHVPSAGLSAKGSYLDMMHLRNRNQRLQRRYLERSKPWKRKQTFLLKFPSVTYTHQTK